MINTCYLDIDGVLAKFMEAAISIHGVVLNEWPMGSYDLRHLIPNKTISQIWSLIDDAGSAHWRELELYPWFYELVGLAKTFSRWKLLTSPGRHSTSASGKVEWMQKNFHPLFRDYIITPFKEDCAAPDRLLIDDSERKVEDFRKGGGNAILFPRPWNDNHRYSNDPMKYVHTEIKKYL